MVIANLPYDFFIFLDGARIITFGFMNWFMGFCPFFWSFYHMNQKEWLYISKNYKDKLYDEANQRKIQKIIYIYIYIVIKHDLT